MTECSQLDTGYTLHDVISQYQDSPNLKGYIATFVNEAIATIDNLGELSTVLGIDCVSGEVLDLIGAIVGQERIWIGTTDLPWFGFEDGGTDPYQLGFGEGKFWDGITSLLGNTAPADDVSYRIFIKAKIIKNNSNGTVEDMIDAMQIIMDRDDVEINGANGEDGVMEISLVGRDAPIARDKEIFILDYDLLPRPAGVDIVSVT